MPIERRKKRIQALQDTLKQLNAMQSFALGEVTQCGGEFAYARHTDSGTIAVVDLDGHLITVDSVGEVEQNPDIKVRA